MDSTPASLLEQVRQVDNRAAWGRFVHLYTPLLYAWAGRAGLQPSDAADLVQDVFATLLRALPEFRYDPARSFRAWLHRLAVNRLIDHRRRRQAAPVPDDHPLLAGLAGADEGAAIDEAEYRREVLSRAVALIRGGFAPATWAAFEATVIDGEPCERAAGRLGLSLNAVYLARGRVLRRLREEVAGLLD